MKNEQQPIEDLAREYLDYLISHNLVVVVERGSTGTVKRCTVHDLIYDFCFQKAVEENFLHVEDNATISQEYNHHARWLFFQESKGHFTHLNTGSYRTKLPINQAYSLIWRRSYNLTTNYKSLFFLLNNFAALTVLILIRMPLPGSTVPEILFTNIHLKFMALIDVPFKVFPRSIVNLLSLETLLIISNKYILNIPKFLWEMKSLCILRVIRAFLDLDDIPKKFVLNNCSK